MGTVRGNQKRMSEANGQYETVIGPDARFKGELSFDKGVCVQGQFEGRIVTKGNIHVTDTGRLKADVEAGNVKIEGQVKGNVNATGKVLLQSSARLEGDLQTARLEVAEGAVFVGHCIVGPQGADAKPAAAVNGSSGKGAAKNSETAKAKAAAPQPARK